MAGIDRPTIDAITHRNAMKHFDFDPFVHLEPSECTVGSLRARATHVDVGPTEPKRPFIRPERPLTLLEMLTRAEHPLLEEQARAEGIDASQDYPGST
jgi:hypothetical protein